MIKNAANKDFDLCLLTKCVALAVLTFIPRTTHAVEIEILTQDSDWTVFQWDEYQKHECVMISPIDSGNQIALSFRRTRSREYSISVTDETRTYPEQHFNSSATLGVDSAVSQLLGPSPIIGPRRISEGSLQANFSFLDLNSFEAFLYDVSLGRHILFNYEPRFAPTIISIGRIGDAVEAFERCVNNS